MARILFAWELGKGFGHLTRYRDMIRQLVGRGHEVIFVSRDVSNATQIFGPMGVPVMQAPVMMHPCRNAYKTVVNLAHLIHNTGFFDSEHLAALARAWRRLFDLLRPDLVLFDHAPTALLAARGYGWKRIVTGSGFMIPPPGSPLPQMRYWNRYDQARLAAEEGAVLGNANRVLKELKLQPLSSLFELFSADDAFLFGFEEMDHYPQRQNGTYLGMFPQAGHGVAPSWPAGFEHRIFAYLYPYDKLGSLLELLARANIATLVYGPEIPDRTRERYGNSRLAFSREPLDLGRVAADGAIAITNGTFGTTSTFLLHGRPVLCIPDNLERRMVARRVVDMGAGLSIDRSKPEELKPALRALVRNPRYAAAAQTFQQRYQGLDLKWQTAQAVERIERLLRA